MTIEDVILKHCRASKLPLVMRQMDGQAARDLYAHRYVVLDMSRTEKDPRPGAYAWETRHRLVAGGETWDAVAQALGLAAETVTQ